MRSQIKLCQAIDALYSRAISPSFESYTQLILDCVRQKDVQQAKRLQIHMEQHLHSHNLTTTSFLHNRLLHLYAQMGHLSDAQNLFDKMPQRDVFAYNAMLSAYSKLGHIHDLLDLFMFMPSRDSVSYNTVISGLGLNGHERKALDIFIRMQRERIAATEYTFVSVLNVCSKKLNLRLGAQIHGRIVSCDLGRNVFVSNALCDLYAKCGEIEKARWMFDKNNEKNLVSWNSMISGYLKKEQVDKGVELFYEMRDSGLKPDKMTVSNVLGALFKVGCVDEAWETFREVKDRDKVCWTSMIVGCAHNGYEDDALSLFRSMLLENTRPDSFTFSSIVSCCAKLASLSHGQMIHSKVIHMGADDDLLVSSALIDMYSKCGEIEDAWYIFCKMSTKNVVSWNSMVVGYAQNGKDLEALALYEEMLMKNLQPDSVTFVGVLSACNHAGLTKLGQGYFYSMKETHGITPGLDHYACMINLLGRSNSTDKAVDLIKGMPHQPNCLIWSTLLSVCKLTGDIQHGEMAARHLSELDPCSAEPYITLSNMYASSGRWNDVALMRSIMKSKQVKKFAAYSWIEMDGEVHKFVAEDRTHPQSELIYLELDRLVKKVQEVGFNPDKKLVLHNVGEDEKLESICYHSEKLALAFAFVRKPHVDTPIRIIKNIRICSDCHVFMKFVSDVLGRSIILRDSNRFHHFVGGNCSCKDLW